MKADGVPGSRALPHSSCTRPSVPTRSSLTHTALPIARECLWPFGPALALSGEEAAAWRKGLRSQERERQHDIQRPPLRLLQRQFKPS